MADKPPTDRLRARLSDAQEWRRQLTAELAHLPETIRELRDAISDLRKVTARLEKVTSGIETMIEHAEAAGLADVARTMEDAMKVVEAQSRAGVGLAGAAMEELQRSMTGAAQLLGQLSGLDRSSRRP